VRYAIGATLVACIAGGAVTLYGGDKMCLALGLLFGTALLVVLLGTFANRLRYLHRLPLIGAPQPPRVTFQVEGHEGMTVRLDADGVGRTPFFGPLTARVMWS
jgi:hypothetical protein